MSVKISKEKTQEYINFATEMTLEEDIDKAVLNLDDNYTSPVLEYYCAIMEEYFDTSNSDELIDFKTQKNELLEKTKKEDLPILKKHLELLSLIEYLYMMKYDKLIKKLIYQSTRSRFFLGAGGYNPLQDPNFAENIRNEAISFATEGFLIGIRRYNTNSETKLITYVTWWIQQRIVYYIEKHATINKGHKKIINDEDMVEDFVKDDGEVEFQKYANVKFENYKFVKTDELEENGDVGRLSDDGGAGYDRHDGKIYDVLRFFCENKDLFLYFEYLIIKYDILLEEYIYFIDQVKDEEITNCFYEEINRVIYVLKTKGYEDLEDFNNIKRYHKLPETLMMFFNLEKSDYLSVKRVLKQKLINILKNIFLDK